METLEQARARFSQPGALQGDTKETRSGGSRIRPIGVGFKFQIGGFPPVEFTSIGPITVDPAVEMPDTKGQVIRSFGIPKEVAFKASGATASQFKTAMEALQRNAAKLGTTAAMAGRAMRSLGTALGEAQDFERMMAKVKGATNG